MLEMKLLNQISKLFGINYSICANKMICIIDIGIRYQKIAKNALKRNIE